MSAKCTIQGRPVTVVDRGAYVTFVMGCKKAPSLPAGVPVPENCEVQFTCFVDAKQWSRVARDMDNPTESIIVDGYPYFDDDLEGLALLAMNVRTLSSITSSKNQMAREIRVADCTRGFDTLRDLLSTPEPKQRIVQSKHGSVEVVPRRSR